jgi:hypothetical protein
MDRLLNGSKELLYVVRHPWKAIAVGTVAVNAGIKRPFL